MELTKVLKIMVCKQGRYEMSAQAQRIWRMHGISPLFLVGINKMCTSFSQNKMFEGSPCYAIQYLQCHDLLAQINFSREEGFDLFSQDPNRLYRR